MRYKIVGDSCCDISKEFRAKENVEIVPLTLTVSGEDIVDDDSFNQAAFISKVSKATEEPKSSCPSPGRYMEAYEGDYDCVFVVTLSANLSGSYNSAEVGRNMYYEEHPEDTKKIHIFDSCSASTGEALIAMMIEDLASKETSFEEIVKKVNDYKQEMKTYFVIESLDTLRKNGRLTGLTAVIASVLNIKPVMGANDEGIIIKLDQARGMDKALIKLAKHIAAHTKNPEEKVLYITHVNAKERAEWTKQEILKIQKFKDVVIEDTRGVASMYACDGGIIISV